ncbi:MAG: hypothetical protein JW874_05145 [Spirochaetales bacterium]|nr:hypothetical protein [Spirochaetales bacterium]
MYTSLKNRIIFISILPVLISPMLCCKSVKTLPPPCHTASTWKVEISCGIDALCLLNGLAGNQLSVQRMGPEIDYWKSRFNQEELDSLDKLTQWQCDSATAMHSLVLKPFSAAGADSLKEIIDLCENPDQMQKALLEIQESTGPRNTYYDEKTFDIFASHLGELQIVLLALDRLGFSAYWEKEISEKLKNQARRTLKYVSAFNIIPEVEKALGFSLPSDKITFYLCEYLQPYGNHVLPGVFATETRIPDEHLVRTAIHELLHDPCYNYDPRFWHTADLVWEDHFIRRSYEHRDTRYGYNNFGYYYVENAVRALEQYISSRTGIAQPLSGRFGPEEDGGMHVLAAVFYEIMETYRFSEYTGGFREFIIAMGKSGILSTGDLKSFYERFMEKTHFLLQ